MRKIHRKNSTTESKIAYFQTKAIPRHHQRQLKGGVDIITEDDVNN